jgi:hypothetical protein
MKRLLILSLALSATVISMHAQTAPTLKKVLELKMPLTEDDDMPGTRGASVTWHTVNKKYYTVFAGNEGYPFAVFDVRGKRLSTDEQKAMIDCRGLWYDPAKKLVSGNAHSDYGWFTYTTDKAGIPTDVDVVYEGMNQPDAQSVGTYNPATKQVLFFYGNQLYMYNDDAEVQDSLVIHWKQKKTDASDEHEGDDVLPEEYNYTSVIYTGIKGQELGFLDATNKRIELYDIKSGFLGKTLSLPETAKTESAFNFAYANGMYWLFDIKGRTWIGYK